MKVLWDWGTSEMKNFSQISTQVSSWRRKRLLQKYLQKNRKKNSKSNRVSKRNFNSVKNRQLHACITDLQSNKTKDLSDPRLRKTTKTYNYIPNKNLPKLM